jgi:hypothetical protein
MSKSLHILLVAVLPLGLLAGCGEERPAQAYKQGTYQGKQIADPWNNEEFKGNQKAWEDAIKQRNQGQNEYVRMGDAPRGQL